jgi:threonylcarbamoyladenosine tRNA methylthiotransferase MtaB
MADPGHPLLPFLHVPMQSGCDRILARMRRRYSIDEFLEFAHDAAARIPDVYFGTDLLVGFPGETTDEFEETLRVFNEGPFAFGHVFSYSERHGTPAARQRDQVDPRERARRSARLRRAAALKRRQFHERHVGRVMGVLFEDPRPGLWPGYTDNYIRVAVDDRQAEGRDLANRIGRVQLDRVCADFVSGTLVGLEPGRSC